MNITIPTIAADSIALILAPATKPESVDGRSLVIGV
jgi:hypothetical protein